MPVGNDGPMARNTLNIGTELKQQQRLTPLQVQFVRMLEMSAPEMEDEVRRALDEMPALEAVDNQDTDTKATQTTEDGQLFTESDRDMQRADFRTDDDVPDYLDNQERHVEAPALPGERYEPRIARASYDPDRYVEPVVTNSDETLFESLDRQVSELHLTAEELAIARYIIGSVDENGYLTRPMQALLDDLAINEGIDTDMATLERMRRVVRSLDPPGVGAVDLRDCLLLQLRRMPRSTRSLTAAEVVADYFDLFSKRHFDRIASAMDITRPQLDDAIELISRLNPKPGSAFPTGAIDDRSRQITPDFLVEAAPDGSLTLTSLSHIPELRVERTFESDATVPEGSDKRLEDARIFLRTKRDDARNFIRVVTQRQETLFRVMSAIVKLQHDFFVSEDDEDIRPMVLRDIAELTGYNLSVISRATQGKYVATLHGVYPLKKFFNEKVKADNDTLTSNRIISAIKKAIESEDPSKPLSDREITARLAAGGYDIARRTVAKYRENLGFPVARLRKK